MQMKKTYKLPLVFALLFVCMLISFFLGSYWQSKNLEDKVEKKADSSVKLPEKTQEEKQIALDKFYDANFKRQVIEDYLPLHADLQKEIQGQEIGKVQLFTLDTGENMFLVETSSSKVDEFNNPVSKKSIYLVGASDWISLEKDIDDTCSTEKFYDLRVGSGEQDSIKTDVRRLLYQVSCGSNTAFNIGSYISVVSLNDFKKLPIYGNSLPIWLKENIDSTKIVNSELTDPIGYGPKMIFQVRTMCSGCQNFNQSVINGVTGQVIDWFDYDKLAGQKSNYFPGY